MRSTCTLSSTHGVHHAIVEVNIVIGVVLGEVLVAHVVPLVVDAVIGLTLGLIAHVVIVVFVEAMFKRIFLYGRYTLYRREQMDIFFQADTSSSGDLGTSWQEASCKTTMLEHPSTVGGSDPK